MDQKISLQAGDVILCCGDNKVSKKITKQIGSPYTHAAICLNADEIGEATPTGIKKRKIEDLISEYSHVACFRLHQGWGIERMNKLNELITDLVDRTARYNFKGILDFYRGSKIAHEIEVRDKLEKYFDGKYDPRVQLKNKYFCSELVVACFIHVGIISTSASVLYKPDTYSPIDLGKDPTFGLFLGYRLANSSKGKGSAKES